MFTSEKAMATQTSTLAWKIPWMEEPGRLQSMGLQKTGHDWVTSLSRFTFLHWRRNWQCTPVSLGNPRNGGAWWVAIYGVAQSQTRLKRLSSTSCSCYLLFNDHRKKKKCLLRLLLLSGSVVSDSLWPHGLQHARLPCPSPSPRTCSNWCPLSRWCHPTISSSVTPVSSGLQSFVLR